MEEVLFKAHFLDRKNVGDTKTLISLADFIGINEDKTRQVLKSDN